MITPDTEIISIKRQAQKVLIVATYGPHVGVGGDVVIAHHLRRHELRSAAHHLHLENIFGNLKKYLLGHNVISFQKNIMHDIPAVRRQPQLC